MHKINLMVKNDLRDVRTNNDKYKSNYTHIFSKIILTLVDGGVRTASVITTSVANYISAISHVASYRITTVMIFSITARPGV